MDFFQKNTIMNSFLPVLRDYWLLAEDAFPFYLKQVSQKDKAQNEAYVKDITLQFQRQIKKYPRFSLGRRNWRKKTYKLLYQVLSEETLLGLSHYLSREKTEDLLSEIRYFIKKVNIDTPEMSFEDMGQAIRNYMVYLMFKELHRDTSDFSLPCYGYSMLYPFTDNYIDSQIHTTEEKARYNTLIKNFLKGKTAVPVSEHDKKTLYFLSAAKDGLNGNLKENTSSPVTELLLMMLEAQEESLSQQRTDITLNYEKRLAISLYKGGMSVFIDRYYVKKEITKEDMIFYLGFGFFLQLADDLQDIKEDSEKGNQTLFTINTSPEAVEKTVNKLLFFITDLCNSFHKADKTFLEFVLLNCYQLILMGVKRSREYFSKEYIRDIEQCSPVSFSFLETMPGNPFQNGTTEPGKLRKVLDALL